MRKKDLMDLGKLLLENAVDATVTLIRTAREATAKVFDTYNFVAELVPLNLPRVPESWYRTPSPLDDTSRVEPTRRDESTSQGLEAPGVEPLTKEASTVEPPKPEPAPSPEPKAKPEAAPSRGPKPTPKQAPPAARKAEGKPTSKPAPKPPPTRGPRPSRTRTAKPAPSSPPAVEGKPGAKRPSKAVPKPAASSTPTPETTPSAKEPTPTNKGESSLQAAGMLSPLPNTKRKLMRSTRAQLVKWCRERGIVVSDDDVKETLVKQLMPFI